MRNTNEQVSGATLNIAFGHWIKASPPGMNHFEIVRSFKEVAHNHDFLMLSYSLPPEAANHVRAMAGPHGYAYCKMLMARDKK